MSLAVLIAAVVMPGGMGAFSLWRGSAAFAITDQIDTGAAQIVSTAQATYLDDGAAFDPAQDTLRAGHTLTVSFDTVVRTTGSTMAPTLGLTGYIIPEAQQDAITATVTTSPLEVSPDPQTVTVTLTLTAESGAAFLGETIDLSATQLTLDSHKSWTDTRVPLDVPLHNVRLSIPTMQIVYNTQAPGGTTAAVLPISGLTLGPVTVDWGDGTTPTVVASANPTHSYEVEGTYTITVPGQFTVYGESVSAAQLAANKSIISVPVWEANGVTDLKDAFRDAANLTSVVEPPVTLTNMEGMFSGATSFNGDISGWDVSHVTNMTAMFQGATAFAQDLSGWDVAELIPLMPIDWNKDAPGLSLENSSRWPEPWQFPIMQLSYDTTLPGATTQIVVPVGGLTIDDVMIDWGDGSAPELVLSADPAHSYAPGQYTVTIYGEFARYGDTTAAVLASNKSLLKVGRWDANGVRNANSAFRDATNLSSVAEPPVSVTTRAYMFFGATTFNGDLSAWDVSRVTDMEGMFRGASSFNSDIGDWDVSRVINMVSMFHDAVSFNQDLSQWNVAKVSLMPAAWNLHVPGLSIENYNNWPMPWQPEVPLMYITYDTTVPSGTTAAVLPINGIQGMLKINWGDGTPVETVTSDFPSHTYEPGAYTIGISGSFETYGGFGAMMALASNKSVTGVTRWDENGVIDASGAFLGAANLTHVVAPPSTVSIMADMFMSAELFNDNISGWDVSHVTNMSQMFAFADDFNQPIGGWDVSHVTDMSRMFQGAQAFAQNLSAWNVEAQLPTMPDGWNLDAPGLALANFWRWPLPWQPAMMQLAYSTAAPGGTTSAVLPISGLTLGAVTIDWGDGSPLETVTAANPSHSYAAGSYTITVNGKFTSYGSADSVVTASNKSIIAVPVWGPNGVTAATFAFYQAANLTSVAAPPATVTSMALMFSQATSFNGDVSGWNVANVTNMSSMFSGATSFNQPIGGWNVSHVTNMSSMFSGATLFNQPIGGWDVSHTTSTSQMFNQASSFNQPLGDWNVSSVTSMTAMFRGASAFAQNLSAWDVATKLPEMPVDWNTSASGLSVTNWQRWPLPWQDFMVLSYDTHTPGGTTDAVLPISGLTLGAVSVDWGDGTTPTVVVSANPTHTYAAGTYTITITGAFTSYGSGIAAVQASNRSITAVTAWGMNGVTIAQSAFYGASNLTSVAQPPATVTSMNSMFYNATSFNGAIGDWDVSHVTNMLTMFSGASAFNGAIGDWDVSNVTNMSGMFQNATAFAQNLSAWDVETHLPEMPANWNTNAPGLTIANLTRWPLPWQDLMQIVFNTAAPDGTTTATIPVSGLTLGAVTIDWGDGTTPTAVVSENPAHSYAAAGSYTITIKGKFTKYGANGLATEVLESNRSLTSVPVWGANGVTDAGSAFLTAKNLTSVAQPPASVTNMNAMFYNAFAFNGDVSGWDVSHVTDMGIMFFQATSFNRNLGNWNVANVRTMHGMFGGATSFNQNLDTWDVSQVTDTGLMFANATLFNGAIGSWNVSNVKNMNSMFEGATSFNGAIGGWDVANVIFMSDMFSGATAFAQSLAAWDVEANFPAMPQRWKANAPGLNTANYARWPLPWQNVMQITYNTAATGGTVNAVLPIDGLTLGAVMVDWGDGAAIETVTAANPTHTYAAGTYTITITGSFTGYGSSDPAVIASNKSITSVPLWRTNGIANLSSAFNGAANLTSVVQPPTTVTNMSSMFAGATSFNSAIGSWNVANVTNMSSMFAGATLFNAALNTWNVTNVTNMSGMFQNAAAFNQSLSSWNVAKVTNMTGMFQGATAFTQSLSAWNVTTNLPMMPANWNTSAPGLSAANWSRWPVPWQDVMQLTYNTAAAGGTVNAVLPIGGLTLGTVTVDWGDGSAVQTVTAANPTHTYASAGTRTITISGSFTSYGSTATAVQASNKSITAVTAWGSNGVTSTQYAFYTATNLTSVAQQPPAAVTNMSYMFYGATSFNGAITGWNVASVTNMSYMFANASAFNQNIGGWSVANVTNMSYMFSGASSFNGAITGWSVANVTNMNYMFQNAAAFNANIGSWNVAKVTGMTGMFQGASVFAQSLVNWNVATNLPTMPANWNTSAPGLSTANSTRWPLTWQDVMQLVHNSTVPGGSTQIIVPISGLTLGTVTINWGDGSAVQTVSAANPSHTYASAGTHTLTIYGSFTAYGSEDNAVMLSNQSITSVPAWRTVNLKSASNAFRYATNLTSVAPPPTTVTDMRGMFSGASSFNGDIAGWNVANVTDMRQMFQDASSFNQNIGAWNVSKVTHMGGMFTRASSFNGDISGWDVSHVTAMDGMFYQATTFNRNIGGWNVSQVTNLGGMFGGASSFNQPLGNWNVANVTNMSTMFYGASVFNQSISTWNVSKVSNMVGMFKDASSFAQNLSAWNVALIPSMPTEWNTNAPGLAAKSRWPLAWQ